MNPTRPGPLLAVAVACAAAAWLILRQTIATLPPLPWTAVPALALLALGEVIAGRNLRGRLSGEQLGGTGRAKPVDPIAVARVAALAKASSVVAAAVGGLAAGAAIYTVTQLEKPVPRGDFLASATTVLAAIALLAAALFLERCCRSEPPGEDDQEPDNRPADWHVPPA